MREIRTLRSMSGERKRSDGSQSEPQATAPLLDSTTHNSARSVIAEATLNALGQGRFRGFSAGSHPSGRVNPAAIELLAGLGYDVSGVRSKSWDEFATAIAPPLDVVITVCDDAAGETCPYWPGHPATGHWGVADPSRAEGTYAEKAHAWTEAHRILRHRIERLVAIPFDATSGKELARRLDEIGTLT